MTQRVNFSILFCTISYTDSTSTMEQTGLDSFTGAIEWRWRTKNQHRSRKVYPFRLSIGQRQYKRYSNHVRRQTVDEVSERLA